MGNKNLFILSIIIAFTLCFSSCYLFYRPTGIWFSEDKKIKIVFDAGSDETDYKKHDYYYYEHGYYIDENNIKHETDTSLGPPPNGTILDIKDADFLNKTIYLHGDVEFISKREFVLLVRNGVDYTGQKITFYKEEGDDS